MLDFRYETFLTLCKIGNYTQTAKALHISQPAVSQHIKFLETYYNSKLFCYKSKILTLTECGEKLRDFALTIRSDGEHLKNMLLHQNFCNRNINFGTTVSIGEFILPKIIAHILNDYPEMHINTSIYNTQILCDKLRSGEINFALVEGFFDKAQYGFKLFSNDDFIAVCGQNHKLANKTITINDILNERIIVRELGSGTRDIFQGLLKELNFTINSFEKICEIGNLSAIKRIVSENLGITFLYKSTVEDELLSGQLKKLNIQGYSVVRDFNFIYLKNSLHQNEYIKWCDYFVNILD